MTAVTTSRQKVLLLLFGTFLALLAMESALRVTGFAVYTLQQQENSFSDQRQEYRILCLGESTTANLLNGESSWPEQLELMLNKRSDQYTFSVFNEGVPGTSTTKILSSLEYKLDKYKPDMVITMMGINDNMYFGTGTDEEKAYYSMIRTEGVPLFQDIALYKFSLWVLSIFIPEENRIVLENSHMVDHCSNREYLEGIIEEGKADSSHYIDLSECYRQKQSIDKAEKILLEALGYYPNSPAIHYELGTIYLRANNDYSRSEFHYMKANDTKSLILLYRVSGRCDDALELIDKILTEGKSYMGIYIEKAVCHFEKNELNKAIQALEKSIQIYPEDERAYYWSIQTYFGLERYNELHAVYDLAKKNGIELNTEKNYLDMYKMLKERGIKLACMTYPLRNVNTLKDIFGHSDDIIYISNEESFREALKTMDHHDLFVDHIAEFGHTSLRGNRMIAENAAEAVMLYLIKRNAINP